MSDNKALPKGLKDEEVERGKIRRPPVPYIPPEDPIQESVEKISGTGSSKVTLPDGTVVYHKFYDGGTNEAFVIHVKEVLNLIKRKNYNDYYEGAKLAKGDCLKRFERARKKSDDAIADPTTSVERAKALEKSLELATQQVMEAELALLKRGKAFFGFYETMLGEASRVRWTRIVDSQVDVMPWTDLKGEVHNVARNHSAHSFMDCVKFHLLTVFSKDAAEHQRYYISYYLKKSRKIPYRNFCDRIEQLNSYIPYLPGLIDSPQGANKKRVEALDEPELAQLLLRLAPQSQQDQWELVKGIIPVDLRSTLDTLVTLEKTDIHVPQKAEKAKAAEQGNGNRKRKGATKGDQTNNKKSRSSKHCELCEKHGGAKNTHNTVDCKRYEKDGTQKKTFQSKKGKPIVKKTDRQSYQTVKNDLKKLRTDLKEIKKRSHKSKKRERESSSDDSNDS
jgi:hypothetical protein